MHNVYIHYLRASYLVYEYINHNYNTLIPTTIIVEPFLVGRLKAHRTKVDIRLLLSVCWRRTLLNSFEKI